MGKPRPTTAPAAALPEESEAYNADEVISDLGQQNASLTVELAAAKSVIRRLRKEKEQLKADLVAKSTATE